MDAKEELSYISSRLNPLNIFRLRSLACFATLLCLAGAALAERLPVKIYTSADGLGSGFVDYIYRDSRGFMWFCTRDGLSRFDGARFINYRIGTDQRSAPGVESVFETPSGVYLVSTTGGTFRIDPNQVASRVGSDRVLSGELVTGSRGSYFTDSKGNAWFLSNALYKVREADGKTALEKVDLGLPPNPRTFGISDMSETADGSLWVNTSWGVLRMLADGRRVFYPVDVAVNSGANSLTADKAGRIWITLGNKILVLKPEPPEAIERAGGPVLRTLTPSTKTRLVLNTEVNFPKNSGEIFEYTTADENAFIENSFAKRLLLTSDGTVWISAENLLLEFRDGIFRAHDSGEGLPAVMTRMGEDSAGNLWVGGHAGLARLNRNGLVTYGQGDGAPSSRFFAITEDADGQVVFAGRDHTLNKLNGSGLKAVRPGLPRDAVYLWTSRFAHRSTSGDWWLLSSVGLHRFSRTGDLASLDGRAATAVYNASNGLKGRASGKRARHRHPYRREGKDLARNFYAGPVSREGPELADAHLRARAVHG